MKSVIQAGMLLLVLGLAGCLKPEPVLYRVSLGMSEASLMEALGPPLSVKEDETGKTLAYQTWTNNMHGNPAHRHDWHVHVSEGRVDSYGLDDRMPGKGNSDQATHS